MGIQRNEIKFPSKAAEQGHDSFDRPPSGTVLFGYRRDDHRPPSVWDVQENV